MFQWAAANPMKAALIAGLFTWGVTALGASLVVFTKSISRRFLDAALGMAAGVMIAASFWSLLNPAIAMCEEGGRLSYYADWGIAWVPALAGFVGGGVAMRLIDKFLPHLHPGLKVAEGPKTSWQRSTLLVLAITIHNIPEGLAVGVAFGAAASMVGDAQLEQVGAAMALALGIGLQNFPEGSAVSFPLRREGMSRKRAFMYGQFSGMVEPAAAVGGAFAVFAMAAILPYALAFAAGAMIFVVAEELIPESQSNNNVDIATMGVIAGFAIMMTLDVALG